ncbi:MAG: PhnD/SsuA/transferrin family substrate-binding protein, partial [Gammaproteobacteria bacterium]|nr:PhnD/SsuA/transferrin family substrate-binding protein [Gammaproteobacteria bacterium]
MKIGILAHRGTDHTQESWAPMARYLSQRVIPHQFVIVPLTNDSIEESVAHGKVDFVLTNPASYAGLEARYGVSRIATVRNRRSSGAYTKFGALIFTRADRTDIRTLKDLKGKTFMA